MWHVGAASYALRGPLGAAAKLTVADNRYGSPRYGAGRPTQAAPLSATAKCTGDAAHAANRSAGNNSLPLPDAPVTGWVLRGTDREPTWIGPPGYDPVAALNCRMRRQVTAK
jgi:hypothetical protein